MRIFIVKKKTQRYRNVQHGPLRMKNSIKINRSEILNVIIHKVQKLKVLNYPEY